MTSFAQKILVDSDRHEFEMTQVSLSAVFSVVTQRSSMGGAFDTSLVPGSALGEK